jgi:histidyl-tRNA synthetase
LEHKFHAAPGPHKLFTIGPMFRHERPQKGRLRQFHQLDCEVLDDSGPQVDAELPVLADTLLGRLGVQGVHIVINSLGCPQCRPAFKQALLAYFEDKKGRLCDDCRRRLAGNPLRVLDCKQQGCRAIAKSAPLISDSWCPDCREHFDEVRRLLKAAGVNFSTDPKLVRGLDYYTRTAFEFKTGELGAQDAVGGGGRYDGLIETLGGPAIPAIGFALGIERLALLIEDKPQWEQGPDLFIAALGDEPRSWAFVTAQKLRKAGLWVEMSARAASLKAQMRRANKTGAAKVLIVGGDELDAGRAPLKDMASGEQSELPLDGIVDRLTAAGAKQVV